MEISRRPARGTALSLEVCQCQGTMQPGVNFISTTEGPLPGSPLRTARVAQSGTPGTAANFAEMPLATTAASRVSWASAGRAARRSVVRRIIFIGGSVWCRSTLVVRMGKCQWRLPEVQISRVQDAADTLDGLDEFGCARRKILSHLRRFQFLGS